MRNALRILTVAVPTLLFAACAFGPGHPRTWAYGVVSASDASPIPEATVSLFSSVATTSASGCFKLQLSSALPLTFAVSARGYKSVEVPAKFGFYRVQVSLEPEASSQPSTVEWRASSEEEVLRAACA